MSRTLGQQLVIETHPGAGSSIGGTSIPSALVIMARILSHVSSPIVWRSRTVAADAVTTLKLEDIRRAWECRDPELATYIAQLTDQADQPPEQPIREGAPTWDDFLRLAFDEIRLAGASEPQVTRKLCAALADLKSVAPPDRQGPLDRQLRLLSAAVRPERRGLAQVVGRHRHLHVIEPPA